MVSSASVWNVAKCFPGDLTAGSSTVGQRSKPTLDGDGVVLARVCMRGPTTQNARCTWQFLSTEPQTAQTPMPANVSSIFDAVCCKVEDEVTVEVEVASRSRSKQERATATTRLVWNMHTPLL